MNFSSGESRFLLDKEEKKPQSNNNDLKKAPF